MPKPNGQPTIPEQIADAKASAQVTAAQFTEFIGGGNWRTAKAARYAKLPHQYVRRSECDAETFERVVNFIRAHGKPEPFFRTAYVYLEHDGWKYWTMGWPPNETEVINRARV